MTVSALVLLFVNVSSGEDSFQRAAAAESVRQKLKQKRSTFSPLSLLYLRNNFWFLLFPKGRINLNSKEDNPMRAVMHIAFSRLSKHRSAAKSAQTEAAETNK